MCRQLLSGVSLLVVAVLSAGCVTVGGPALPAFASHPVTTTIVLKDGAASEDVEALQRDLIELPHVDAVIYVSKAEALKRIKKRYPELAEDLRGNPLPASLEIVVSDTAFVEDVVREIERSEHVPQVAKDPQNPVVLPCSYVHP